MQKHSAAQPHEVSSDSQERFRTTRRNRITGRSRVSEQLRPDPVVASFERRERAVAYVADLASQEDVDIAGIQIVGRDPVVVEHVLGPRSWTSTVLPSALRGLVIGAVVGLVIGAADPVAPASSAMFGLLFVGLAGLLFGALFGVIAHLMDDSGVDAVSGIAARRYDVLAPPELREQLARMQGGMGSGDVQTP